MTDSFARPKAIIDLKYNSYYIAGATNNVIYIGNFTNPFHLTTFSLGQHSIERTTISLTGIDSLVSPEAFKIVVDSPVFYLFHGINPLIVKGQVGSWTASEFMEGGRQPYFVESVPINKESFVLRFFSTETKQYELGKRINYYPFFTPKFGLLKKQIDGLFCLDGKLHVDKNGGKIVYLHHYRNQFVVTDANLNLSYIGHTIDTFSHARINVAHIRENSEYTLSAPPAQVNLRSDVSADHLYIQSNVMARNEDVRNFQSKEVIDMYELDAGSYQFSFYISRYEKNKMLDFKIVNEQYMAAIHSNYLIIYEFDNRCKIKFK